VNFLICPVCGTPDVIFDSERAQYVCGSKGIVIEENIADLGPEWRNFEDETMRIRAGPPVTFTVHTEGFGTIVGTGDWTRKQKLRTLQNKSRVSSKERKKVTYLTSLNRLAGKLNLPRPVRETAGMIVKILVEAGLAKRVDPDALTVAVLHYACRVHRVPLRLQDLEKLYEIEEKEVWNATQKVIQAARKLNLTPKLSPAEYVPSIANKLGLPGEVMIKSMEIVNLLFQSGGTSGKDPAKISAAAVYLVSTIMDVKKTQKEVSEALNITEVAVRGGYRDIVEKLDIDVVM